MRLILAGGGHGHVNIVKEFSKKLLDDVEVMLISDNRRQYYSGMLPGFLGGRYTEDEMSFDLEKLCRTSKVRFINEKIIEIDAENKRVITEKDNYSYDLLSLNLGGMSVRVEDSRDSTKICYTKPIAELAELKKKDVLKSMDKLIIVGGGAAAVETALALRVSYPELKIELFTKGERILRDFNDKAREVLEKELRDKKIRINSGYRFKACQENKFIFERNGVEEEVDSDILIVSNGIKGAEINFKGLKTDRCNFIKTDRYLRVDNDILAMGDMIDFNGANLPKAGVFAIHQADILYKNLLKLMNGEKDLYEFNPNKKYLQIINLGEGKAQLHYGKVTFKGRTAFIIKDYIDRRYMRKK